MGLGDSQMVNESRDKYETEYQTTAEQYSEIALDYLKKWYI